MSDASLAERITDAMKAAMKAREKKRLGVIRLMRAAIKQREVDERIALDDAQVLITLDKMLKQRRDSIAQFEKAGRTELAEQEAYEIGVIQEYLPKALTTDEIATLIEQAMQQMNATTMKDMGKVMGMLKPQLQGRADTAKVSQMVKQKLL